MLILGVVPVRSCIRRHGDDHGSVLAGVAVRCIEHVRLDGDDVVVVAQLTGGRRHAKVEAGGEANSFGVEALLPVAAPVDVGSKCQCVIVVANADVGVVLDAAELGLAAGELRVRPVLVVVVADGRIVDHRRDVRVRVRVGAILVGVRVQEDAHAEEVVGATENVA